ncbi:hypothetical protein [Nostoc sp. TCL26-01]|uniref:hypothetical protein n=1 Tax=Nostoc sp. TCL26-01 TaxID=2576904 RepID=UPI0015BD74B8|nr:hypothetical protein [Nostoc sp. TCL26-01]QLE56338.1 hypothetical protein FD725_12805 [Nostoc sp. TCL26-01]
METQEKVEFVGLPLAVYREIAAHLRQVEGVEVSLIPQSSPQFDYQQSQIDSLSICWRASSNAENRQRVQEILTYYKNRYASAK